LGEQASMNSRERLESGYNQMSQRDSCRCYMHLAKSVRFLLLKFKILKRGG